MPPPTIAMLRQPCFTSGFCKLLLLLLLLTTGNPGAASASTKYSIVLASAPGKNLPWEPQKNHLLKKHTVYVEQATIKGAQWERLCLGFFNQRSQAASILKEVQQTYPGAWIQKASENNIAAIISGPTGITVSTKSGPASTTLTEKQLDSLMKRAKTDFKNKNYASATRYLKALIAAGDHKYSREALELLGLSRQRRGQNAHAVATYKKYLERYPDDEDSDRVRQRLAGLLTANRASREKIDMRTIEERDEVTSFGSLAQFYQSNQTTSDGIGTVSTVSQLFTFFDLTTIQRTSKFDHRYQFTSDHIYDFIDNSDNAEFRFIDTYYEFSYRRTGSSARFGRQRLQVAGILQRFDGISAGYQFNQDMRINVLGGFPVDIDNKNSINKHKTFYGLTFETGTFLENWNMNLFYFEQQNDGLTDRTSIGTEVRYRDKRKALFSLIDYDLFYDEINILQLNANFYFDYGRTAFLNAYMRKSPLLSTSNALIGRQEQSIEELKKVLNIEQIYQLAKDRTADSETITVGGSQPISEKFQVTADITFSHVGDTVASGGVLATPDTGTDYFINTQLVGNNLLMKHDTSVFGIRYYETDPSSTVSFIANSRYPLARKWRINPRLQFDIRKFNEGRSQKRLRAIIRTDYRYLNKARFDFDIGYNDVNNDTDGQALDNSSLFFNIGYRWDF